MGFLIAKLIQGIAGGLVVVLFLIAVYQLGKFLFNGFRKGEKL